MIGITLRTRSNGFPALPLATKGDSYCIKYTAFSSIHVTEHYNLQMFKCQFRIDEKTLLKYIRLLVTLLDV